MTDTDTVTLTRAQYEALLAEKETLEDQVAALDADDGSRIPHEVALAIMQGERPIVAFEPISASPCESWPRERESPPGTCPRSNAGANPALQPLCHALPGSLGRRLTPW